MPIASTAALPTEVLIAVPDEGARTHLMRVFNSAQASGETDERSWNIAWRGLGNAGWSKGADGTFGKVAKRVAVAKRADGSVSFRVPIDKADGTDDEVEVSGWSSMVLDANGAAIVDHDEEAISVPTLKSAAADFLAKSREFNAVDHYSQPCGFLTQSVVMDPATQVAMGFPGDKPTGWWVSAKIRGPAAKRVRSGELREFSIEATAIKRRSPAGHVVLDALEVNRITLVDAGAGIGVRIESVKTRQGVAKSMDPTIEALLAKYNFTPEDKDAFLATLAKVAATPAPKADEPPKDPPMSEEVKKRFDAERLEREEANKKLEAVQKQLADRDLADSRREYVAKAKALKFATGSHDDLGEGLRILSSLASKDADHRRGVEAVLKNLEVLNGIAAKSEIFHAQGLPRAPEVNSAQAQLDAKAREIATRDPDLKAMPVAKALKIALDRAYSEHPDLYKQIRGN